MSKNVVYREYGGKTRIRVCGVLVEGDAVLLVRHKGLNKSNEFWLPPGGGLEHGASVEQNLIREIKEETGLEVKVVRFLFTTEYFSPPLHAIELFFEVEKIKGTLCVGNDPELKSTEQLIDKVEMLDFNTINSLPRDAVHGILRQCHNCSELLSLQGFFKFENYV